MPKPKTNAKTAGSLEADLAEMSAGLDTLAAHVGPKRLESVRDCLARIAEKVTAS